jgi:LPXTG-motif cell wall-anchored protein
VKGTFSGTLTINVKNATLNPSPQTGGCTGITSDCALKAIFGPNAVVTGASFSAVYTANCGQLLVQSVWHNSSSRNTGDIASKRPGFRAHVTCAKPVVKKAPAKVTTTTTTLAQTGGGLPMAPLAGLLLIGLGGALVLRRKTA